MKKLAAALLLSALVCLGRGEAQTTQTTPNIGLQLPAFGQQNWNLPLTFNFTQLDQLLSGNAPLPSLNLTTGLKLNGSYGTANSILVSDGSGTVFSTITALLQAYPSCTTVGYLFSVNSAGTGFQCIAPGGGGGGLPDPGANGLVFRDALNTTRVATVSDLPTGYPYGSLNGAPTLAPVATSGAYSDLTGKPTIPAAQVQTDWNAVSGLGVLLHKPTNVSTFTNDAGYLTAVSWSIITGKPTFATVATSGAYSDLSGKPTLASTFTPVTHEFVTGYSATSGAFSAAQPAWADISGAPTSLPPNGTAGGDLTGTFPNPTLATVNPDVGSCGDGTHVCQVILDAKGRVITATPVSVTVNGDASLNPSTGALTVTKTAGAAFAASATVDATNASNIAAGTLASARIAATIASNTTGNAATATALAAAPSQCASGTFATGVSANGTPNCSAPVTSITGTSKVAGDITFAGSGVSQSGNTFTFSGGSGGSGTVTAVTFPTAPSWLAAAVLNGSTTPAISLTAATGQSSHLVIGTCGAATSFGPCALSASDIPVLNQSTTGTASNVTGTVAVVNGGTGATTIQGAINALTGTQTAGRYLRSDGTNATLSTIQAADVPTLNQSTTGTASNITGVASIANGGTGQTTANAAFNALSPLILLGDTLYAGASGVDTRLAGNTTTTTQFLMQTGTGTVSAAPVWGAITAGNIPTLNQSTTGNAATATALAATPTQCNSGNFSTGIAANGNANCLPGGPGTVTSVGLSVPSSSIFGVASSPITTTGTISLQTTGTSGGLPYFSSASTIASTPLLANHGLIVAKGAGAAPIALTPAADSLPLWQSASGDPTVTSLANCSSALTYSNSTHTFGCNASVGTGAASPTAATTTGTTYYVSQSLGSDSNNGTSLNTPWKTLGKLCSTAFSPGDQGLLFSQDVWHEQCTIASSGMSGSPITISSYGPNRCPTGPNTPVAAQQPASCSLPIIDGADAVTGWTVNGTYSDVYQAPYTATAAKAFEDSLYADTTAITLQSSLANVHANGGVFSDGTNAYVKLPDGTSPANHTIEISGARAYGIYEASQNYITVDGVEIVRQYNSGVRGDQTVDNSGGTRTNEFITVRNSRCFNIGDSTQASKPEGCVSTQGKSSGAELALRGWVVANNRVGTMDVPRTLNYGVAGIQLHTTTGAVISGNYVSAVNSFAIQVRDGSNTTSPQCDTPTLANNEVTNSLGNIEIGGCTTPTAAGNYIHDSFGFGIGLTNGAFNTARGSTAAQLNHNTITRLLSAFTNTQYNGIDCNSGGSGTGPSGGFARYNDISQVSAASFTLETACTGWTLIGNNFDASQNVSSTNTPTGTLLALYMISGSSSGYSGYGNKMTASPSYANAVTFNGTPETPQAYLAANETLYQNTTGNAATATALAATPTLCSTGQAPTGILANGNATGCAPVGGTGVSLTPSSTQTITPTGTTTTGLIVKGAASTTVNQFAVEDSSSGVHFAIDPSNNTLLDGANWIESVNNFTGLEFRAGGGNISLRGGYLSGDTGNTVTLSNTMTGGTGSVGDVVHYSADNTVSDCPTSCSDPVGIAASFSAGFATNVIFTGINSVNFDGTYSPSAGWYACTSATTAGKITPQSAACSTKQVGIVTHSGSSATSGLVQLTLGGGGTGGGGGSGTVTSVATGTGLTGGPITGSGTVSCNTASSSVVGCVKVDGTTITASGGIISAVGGGGSGVSSINSTTGAFTFSGTGVSCSGTTCTFTAGSGSFAGQVNGVALTTGGGLNLVNGTNIGIVNGSGANATIGITGTLAKANQYANTAYYDDTTPSFSNQVYSNGLPVSEHLSGTTSSIGGSSVASGACTTGPITVTGVLSTYDVHATPQTYPGDGFEWSAYMSSTNTVTVRVCNRTSGSLTPTASLYNVAVTVLP